MLPPLSRMAIATCHEFFAASQCDGIGILAKWILQKDGSWKVYAIDTEGADGFEEVTEFGEEEPVPPTPPICFN